MADLNLTTVSRVLAFLDLSEDAVRDGGLAELGVMVSAVSGALANLCNRPFLVASRTERRSLFRPTFKVMGGPARSIASVKMYPSGALSSSAAVIPATGYELQDGGNTVAIGAPFVSGMVYEVAYTGGLAEDTDEVIASFPDLEEACKMQVAYLWQRHKSLGRTSMDLGGGSTSFVKDYDLLPGVRTILTRYARPYTFC